MDTNVKDNWSYRFRVWVCDDDGLSFFGEGRRRLLEAISETGSIRSAAEKMNMSYRKAWDLLKKTENRLGVHLVERQRGGVDHGHTELTEAGKEILDAFSRFRADVEDCVRKAGERYLRCLASL